MNTKLFVFTIFAIFMMGCNEEQIIVSDTGTSPSCSETSITDTSYMWLDTTKAEYLIENKDTVTIYTYHTNGMSALLRIYDIDDPHTPTRIIYQDSKGIPRAVTFNLKRWRCLDRVYMDKLIQLCQRLQGSEYYQASYYQALFFTGLDRFRLANNPVACEGVSY